MNVVKPSTPMRSKPNQTSELETECLFGENLKILDEQLQWCYCKLLTDNYIGWVQKRDLGRIMLSTHRVISKRTFLFRHNDVKSGCVNYLPLGSQICVEGSDCKWSKVKLYENYINKYAYVPNNHIIKIGRTIKDWVSIAEKLIGVPYVWGGRNSIGLDCSALLQLSYQTYGQNISRNSIDQSLLNKEVIKEKGLIKRGCVIFWKGHVGIMADKTNCIHANAFHMEVSKEPLAEIISRTKEDNPILKIMNFD